MEVAGCQRERETRSSLGFWEWFRAAVAQIEVDQIEPFLLNQLQTRKHTFTLKFPNLHSFYSFLPLQLSINIYLVPSVEFTTI